MTMLRAVASALVLAGALTLLLSVLGLAGGELDKAPAGLLGLALLAVGLVLFSRMGGRRARYGYATSTGDPAAPYGPGAHGAGQPGPDPNAGDAGCGWPGNQRTG
ncbi:hypothetical protein E1258_17865 [Micromonospora sp. KC207]|uniref:hypothetical protein n=1 Tax=Micromonospora sp. KC207 TaxID=2530377 RepID=UPI0010511868|nr:hypothetical protein [Micromonospora sp. KC207]TDC59471.1 hypothetical protein E1258_17865 [Micromonospora sp. KC207]